MVFLVPIRKSQTKLSGRVQGWSLLLQHRSPTDQSLDPAAHQFLSLDPRESHRTVSFAWLHSTTGTHHLDTIESLQSLTLQDIPYLVRKNWRIIALCAVVGAGLGGLKSLGVPVSYRATLLMRIEERDRMQANSAEITRLAEDLKLVNPIEGEIEIVKSRHVLGNAVRENGLGLNYSAQRSLKDRVLRRPRPSIKTAYFHAPDSFQGRAMSLYVVDPRSSYLLLSEKNDTLVAGRFDEPVDSTSNPYHISMLIKRVGSSDSGQMFDLDYNDQAAVAGLAANLSVDQVGKLTGLLRLNLVDYDPEAVANKLNAIADAYVRQSIRRRSDEAQVRYNDLNNQLPVLRDSLAASEERLKRYRLQVGSVNTDRESEQVLSQQNDLNRQILELERRRKELMERFTPDHASIRSLDDNIEMIRGRLSRISGRIHVMPAQQQEIERLERDLVSKTDQYNMLVREVSQLQIVRDQKVANVKIIDPATYGEPMARRGKGTMLAIGTFVGLCLGFGIAIARRLMDSGVDSARLIELIVQRPILCYLPHSKEEERLSRLGNGNRRTRLLAAEFPNSLTLESLRGLILPVRHALSQGTGKFVVFAGPAPKSGKSTVAANFAAILAQAGQKVLLIDADMRRGTLQTMLGCKSNAGLAEVLSNHADLESSILDTPLPNLRLLPSGAHTNRSTSLLQSDAFDVLLARLSEHYDAIIADVPPVLALADAQILATRAVATVLVLKHGAHSVAEISALRKRMEISETHIVGSVLNDIPSSAPVEGVALSRQIYGYTANPDA